jgi:predicted CDP-diglyceride synthetase/phosphatidate cytidylyltransferase
MMTIEITPNLIYTVVAMFLMAMQVYQHRQLDKARKEIDKIWQQISTWNTMIALKLLENQKELDKLNKKDNTNGVTEKI